MVIHKLLTPYNHSTGTADRIKYIVIHYVGATGGAEANCKYYAEAYRGASAHYYVDFDGSIWQSVEDANVAWHCGAKSYKHAECRNSNSVGIEMCVRNKDDKSDTSKDWYFEDATVEATIKLTRDLMDKYGVGAEHVLRHYDVTGKICPNPYVYNHTAHTWEQFKSAIAAPKYGWVQDDNGWWYRNEDGSFPKSEWKLIDKHWYYFSDTGYMKTGWQNLNGKWYYLEESGGYAGACWHEAADHSGALERWTVE